MRPINCVIVSKHWLQRNWFEHVMLYFVWCFSYRWGADTGWIFHGSKPQWSFAIGNQPSSACDCSCLSERWPLEILSVNARNWCVISTVVCSEVNSCQLIWFFWKVICRMLAISTVCPALLCHGLWIIVIVWKCKMLNVFVDRSFSDVVRELLILKPVSVFTKNNRLKWLGCVDPDGKKAVNCRISKQDILLI